MAKPLPWNLKVFGRLILDPALVGVRKRNAMCLARVVVDNAGGHDGHVWMIVEILLIAFERADGRQESIIVDEQDESSA